ncbi:hypothetical protein SAMN04490202_2161 [Pseudomonas reinekei]|jgi:hypothetical protein|uniref:Uncharacterized protein n=1 Tax=Pseudomonas reinekei TaxID=395598 RepID=A0A1H0N829_PSERE|nr:MULTISPECIES: hypothetical protein [Pseudomonas]KAB0483544.1 hypothetical protein F7R15_20790 [Pseudomonas reinekei]OLU02289.1 hypothetical protein BVK86_15675 [Pseudomonas reinekei]SDO88864.1 hypothetical protein SAMN04490202_2161 [Pseudomonas reinekei]
MKVTIDNVAHIAEEILVTFSTDIGKAAAIWNGVQPKIGEIHDVELEIEQSVFWGRSAHRASNDDCFIGFVDGLIKLTGNMVSVDAEGMMAFEVAGSVILVEIIGFAGNIPMVVDLYVERVDFFPTGI